MDAPLAIDTAAFVLLLLGAAALGAAYFRAQYTKNTIQQLKDLSDALDKRVKALEDEKDILTAKIDRLEQENEILRGLVNGESQFDALVRLLEDNHQEVMMVLGSHLRREG